MKRREFMTLLGGAAAAWPVAASGQQPAMPVIGLLNPRSRGDDPHLFAAFRQGLKDAGYVEGENVAIEYRFAENTYGRLPELAADLVQRQVSVIAAFGAVAAVAAKAATMTIPVVFGSGSDPIRLGLVASLSHPGGNLTGYTQLTVEVAPKRLELLHEVAPAAKEIALLVNPNNPLTESLIREMPVAARKLGLRLHFLHASTVPELQRAFASMAEQRVGGLVVGSDAFFNGRSEELAQLATQHAFAAIYQYRTFAAAGGLMSYGGSITNVYRQVATYVARVLKGEKPADLPVQQATKIELIINLKTAKALGLIVSWPLLARADEVIE